MSESGDKKTPFNRLVLSSDEIPRDLEERVRKRMMQDVCDELFLGCDMFFEGDDPLDVRFTLTSIGDLQLFEYRGTMTRYLRTPQHIAADGRSDLPLCMNFDGRKILSKQLGQEVELGKNDVALFATGDPGDWHMEPGASVQNVMIPRDKLAELVPESGDHIQRKLNPTLPATQLLQRYVAFLFGSGDLEADPDVNAYMGRTLTDLVALALGAEHDAAEVAMARGVRSARLQLVLGGIRSGYDDPSFSAETLAKNLGITPRYIRNLLYETGVTFSERVLELRLQKARRMLSNPRHNSSKVSDIALACGFNDISYFNNCFRRRFGAAPTQYRG